MQGDDGIMGLRSLWIPVSANGVLLKAAQNCVYPPGRKNDNKNGMKMLYLCVKHPHQPQLYF